MLKNRSNGKRWQVAAHAQFPATLEAIGKQIVFDGGFVEQ